ncbi:hypothetical protein TNIN_185241 [Trichonephila inaurata madagascariensis]|uniref:Uncharacterized protein n=1 Tax=Trichonephila inaurata madagascariensis TaxID=2747483 RepID=A0A8X6K042_9ARAC|nr:hypothetical protein TNIN_185241 [Trichonephila inaurata madagascariensis]
MSDSEREIESISGASYKSRACLSSLSGNSTPSPPLSNCEMRRRAMATIQSMDTNITTNQSIIDNEKKNGYHVDTHAMQKNIETILEIKQTMVSELRTMPPCLEPDCPDHTILKPVDSVLDLTNLKDKKQPQHR